MKKSLLKLIFCFLAFAPVGFANASALVNLTVGGVISDSYDWNTNSFGQSYSLSISYVTSDLLVESWETVSFYGQDFSYGRSGYKLRSFSIDISGSTSFDISAPHEAYLSANNYGPPSNYEMSLGYYSVSDGVVFQSFFIFIVPWDELLSGPGLNKDALSYILSKNNGYARIINSDGIFDTQDFSYFSVSSFDIPEPGAIWLLGTGLIFVFILRKLSLSRF